MVEIPLSDKVIPCVDCGCEFVWNAGEQAYYISKGLAAPKRCQPCRTARKNSIVKVSPKEVSHD